MNRQEFLRRLAEVLDHDGEIAPDQAVQSIIEWDSLGILSVIELLTDLGLKVHPDALRDLGSIAELIDLARPVLND